MELVKIMSVHQLRDKTTEIFSMLNSKNAIQIVNNRSSKQAYLISQERYMNLVANEAIAAKENKR